MGFPRRLLNLLRAGRTRREIRREMDFHLAERTDDLIDAGADPDQARREAGRQFGNDRSIGDRIRDVDVPVWIESVVDDLRFAIRSALGRPLLSLAVVLTLALGIGITGGFFSFLNALEFAPRVLAEPETFAEISSEDLATTALYERLREGSEAFASLAARSVIGVRASLGEDPTAVGASLVSCNYLEVYRAVPLAGRLLQPSDCAEAAPVAVISESLWRVRFGGDPAIVGQSIQYGGERLTVVGIAAPYRWEYGGATLLVPYTLEPELTDGVERFFAMEGGSVLRSDRGWLELAGRLAPGHRRRQAASELRVLSGDPSMRVTGDSRWATGDFPLWAVPLFLAFPTMLTLLTSVNASTLLLSRATGRQREMAIRLALGTSRSRLLRMLLIEVGLLAALAVPLSLILVERIPEALFSRLVGSLMSVPPPFGLDWRVYLYLAGAAVLAAVASGLTPAREALRRDLAGSLGEHPRAPQSALAGGRVRGLLLAAQVALSTVPLVVAGAFVVAVNALPAPSTNAEQIVVADLARTSPDLVREAIASLPGARRLAASDELPMTGRPATIETGGRSGNVYRTSVSAEYFETMGLRVVGGRIPGSAELSVTETLPAPAAVSESFVRDYFPDGLAPRQRVSLGADEYEIVAVVAEQTTYSRTGGNPGDPTLYRFLPPGEGRFLVVRVDGDVGAFADAVRTAVRDAVSTPISVMNLAVEFERYVDDGSQAYQTIFVAMGSVAFALALAGIVGLGAYATRLRRKEVAIRVALGADRGDILGMLLASGLRPVPVGLLVGILTAFAAIRLFSLQMRVDALEPVPYVFAAVLLVGAVAASSLATGYWLLRWEPARPLRQD